MIFIIFIYKFSNQSKLKLNPIVNWKKKLQELKELGIKELIIEKLKSYINFDSKFLKDFWKLIRLEIKLILGIFKYNIKLNSKLKKEIIFKPSRINWVKVIEWNSIYWDKLFCIKYNTSKISESLVVGIDNYLKIKVYTWYQQSWYLG